MKYEVVLTKEFESWLISLTPTMQTRIKARLEHVSLGHFGFHKRFDKLIELKWINGVRIYACIWDTKIVVMLNGGNKNGQSYDIKKAKKIQTDLLNGIQTIFKPRT